MKKVLSIFAALALVFALVGCVNGQGSKGLKSAKEQIKAAVVQKDAKAKVKFTGGQFVYLKEQTVSTDVVLFSVDSNIPESWYYEITVDVTSAEGDVEGRTYYYFFKKGASVASESNVLSFSNYKSGVEDKSFLGKVGKL